MLRRLSRIALLTLAGLVAGSVVAELAFRIIEATPLWRVLPVPEVSLYGPDPFTGYRHRKYAQGVWVQENRTFVKISNLGLRDRDRPLERSGATRVVIVGDSVIEALQVDLNDTAVAVAERELAARNPGAEVVNLGLAGATPAVQVARLQSVGLALKPDLAVVVTTIGDFLGTANQDDSGWTAYRSVDGNVKLTYGFRRSRGYKFRTSRAGDAFYWALDHSALARSLNNRKNIGLLAEWPQKPGNEGGSSGPASCGALIQTQVGLWTEGRPELARRHLDAFLRDLSELRSQKALPIVVAFRGLPPACDGHDASRRVLVETIRGRLAASGLQFVDMETKAWERMGPRYIAIMHGFGGNAGAGHMNQTGNRIYGEIFRELISTALSRG